jgi:hypothetical protein
MWRQRDELALEPEVLGEEVSSGITCTLSPKSHVLCGDT